MTGFKKGDRVTLDENAKWFTEMVHCGHLTMGGVGTIVDLDDDVMTVQFHDGSSDIRVNEMWLTLADDDPRKDPMAGTRSRTNENLRGVFG